MLGAQLAREIEEVAHLGGIGQAREHVGVESADANAAVVHICEKFVTLGSRRLFQKAFQRPDGFQIPFVTRIRRIVSGCRGSSCIASVRLFHCLRSTSGCRSVYPMSL